MQKEKNRFFFKSLCYNTPLKLRKCCNLGTKEVNDGINQCNHQAKVAVITIDRFSYYSVLSMAQWAAYPPVLSMVRESYRISRVCLPRNAGRVTLYVGHARKIRGSDVYARYYVYASASPHRRISVVTLVPFLYAVGFAKDQF